MTSTTFAGILSIGFVFGYLLYHAVRHTKEFNIDLLSSAIGALDGATVIGLLGKTDGWIGPYRFGLGLRFLFYLILALILMNHGRFAEVAGNKVMLLGKTLLGSRKQE